MDKACCCGCAVPVGKDEIAITKRLINRGAKRYYCQSCLADAFGITAADIDRCIQYYKRMGCTLFA